MPGKTRFNRFVEEIGDAKRKVIGAELNALKEIKQKQSALTTLLGLEARRLKRKKGEKDPRVNRLVTRRLHNIAVVKNLEAQIQIKSLDLAPTDKGVIVQQGRITDDDRCGLSDLDVSLVDLKGKLAVPGLKTRTDRFGYYAFVVEPEDAGKIEEAAKKGLILKIETEDGRTIHSEKDPLKLASGAGTLAEVMVDRRKIFERPIRVTPVKKKKPTDKSVNEAAETDLKKVKGIGPRAEAKLKKAGIKNIRDLAGSDDARIKAALGDVRADLLRKSALSVLKKGRR